MIAQPAVMGHMSISHEQIAVADLSQAAAPGSAPMQGGEFPDDVIIPDDQSGFFALKFQVLGNFSDYGKLKDPAALADAGVGANNYMRTQMGIVSDGDIAIDDAIRPHGHAGRPSTAPGSTMAVGWISGMGGDLLLGQGGHKFTLGHDITVNQGFAHHFPNFLAAPNSGHFHNELIPGNNLPAETNLIHAEK